MKKPAASTPPAEQIPPPSSQAEQAVPDCWYLTDPPDPAEMNLEDLLVMEGIMPPPRPYQAPAKRKARPKRKTSTSQERHGRSVRLAPDCVLSQLPERLGQVRQNIRTEDVLTEAYGVLSGNEISRLYLRLSTSSESWPKEATYDAVIHLATCNRFDPVREYLEGNRTEPLPLEVWEHLDEHLLGIKDSIAAKFLPRYLISAVARTLDPGCYVRQIPVLIGPQERGKSEMGRILFGTENWVEGVGQLDRDALQRAHMAWGVELAELDGVTRRKDQEQLKAFLTETWDTYQIRYDRCPGRHPRRFVFWGTSNRPPLRDSTGSTRFVCIPIPDKMLPLDWARDHRDALWARALEQYRSGVTWLRTDEQERLEVEARNADFLDEDPWSESVGQYLNRAAKELSLPAKVPEILMHLEVPKERHTSVNAKRVRDIAEKLGWRHGRRRISGNPPREGLWPPDDPVHPVHRTVHPSCTPQDVLPRNGSGPAVHPVHPISQRVKEKEEESSLLALVTEQQGESGGQKGCTGCTTQQVSPGTVDLEDGGGVHAGVHGVHTAEPPSGPVLEPLPVGPGTGGTGGTAGKPWHAVALRIHREHPEKVAPVVALELHGMGYHNIQGRQVAELWGDQ